MCSLWPHPFSIWLINLRCYTKQWDTAAPHLWSHLSPSIALSPHHETEAAAGDVLKSEVRDLWEKDGYRIIHQRRSDQSVRGQSRAAGLGAGTAQWCTVLKVSCSSGTGSNSKYSVDVSMDRPSQDMDYQQVRSREVQRRWLMFEIELNVGQTPKEVWGLSDLRALASILLFPIWWVHGRFVYINQHRRARQRPKQPSKIKISRFSSKLRPYSLLYYYCYILNVQCKFTLSFLQLFVLKLYRWMWRNKCNV